MSGYRVDVKIDSEQADDIVDWLNVNQVAVIDAAIASRSAPNFLPQSPAPAPAPYCEKLQNRSGWLRRNRKARENFACRNAAWGKQNVAFGEWHRPRHRPMFVVFRDEADAFYFKLCWG